MTFFFGILIGGTVGAVAMALFSMGRVSCHPYGWELKSFLRRCTAAEGGVEESLQIRSTARKLLRMIYEEES